MFTKRLEVFDPERPPVFYYTNYSNRKPKSILEQCQPKRKIQNISSGKAKVMIYLAMAYCFYLFFIALVKPQFAMNYASEYNRRAVFGYRGLEVKANAILKNQLQNTLDLMISFHPMSNMTQAYQIQHIYVQKSNHTQQDILNNPIDITKSGNNVTNLQFSIPSEDIPKNFEVVIETSKHETRKLKISY